MGLFKFTILAIYISRIESMNIYCFIVPQFIFIFQFLNVTSAVFYAWKYAGVH